MTARGDSWAVAGAFWDEQAVALGDEAALERFGTVTRTPAVVRHRDRLEKAHLERLLSLDPATRVLDLGGGAGRIAHWLAPRVAEVVLVDASATQIEIARRRAQRLGIRNLRAVRASVLEFESRQRFDVVLCLGVAAHLDDEEVGRLGEVLDACVAPGGRVIVKEPVTTDGSTREDVRKETGGGTVYRAHFRSSGFYREAFGSGLRCTYESPTLAHPIPWFLGGTEELASKAECRVVAGLLERASPALVAIDPTLLRIERRLRGHPVLRRLLAPVNVLQHYYVFDPAPAPSEHAAEEPELSIVVIAYNESECLAGVVDELCRTVDALGIRREVILVDDGSTDGTLRLMRDLSSQYGGIRVVANERNLGIGGALRAGFDQALGQWITWIPADGQIQPAALQELWARRNDAAMLTTVYRSRDDPWFRTVVSSTLNALIRLRTGRIAKSGGNYLFSRSVWQSCAPRSDDTMMMSTAFRHRLLDAGHEIEEVMIDCRARQGGRSKVLDARTITRTLAGLLSTK